MSTCREPEFGLETSMARVAAEPGRLWKLLLSPHILKYTHEYKTDKFGYIFDVLLKYKAFSFIRHCVLFSSFGMNES